jgi:hypothetical protein
MVPALLRERSVTRHSFSAPFILTMAMAVAMLAASASAARSQTADDDDAKLRPAEPDFTVVNIPTTLPLPVHAGNFHLTHRFGENLRNDPFSVQASNLFGIDEGAIISFEYRFGVMKHLEAIAARTNFDRDIQLSAKYDAFHQNASRPVGFSALIGVDGGNNFRRDYRPSLGAVISRTMMNKAAFYATPIWVHNTAATTGITRDTMAVGLGARLTIVPTVYVVIEGTPRLAGYTPGTAEYAFGLEKRVGLHVFQLTLANSAGTTYGQLVSGGIPHNLQLGFNLARKFF